MSTPISIPYRHRRLGYVALNVTDLDRSIDFYRDLVGLDVSERHEGMASLRCGRDHHNVLLCASEEPGLKRIAFELESEADLDRAVAHLTECGLAPVPVDEGESKAMAMGRAIRFRVPGCGLCLEYYVRQRYMALPFEARLAKIERLGHIVLQVREFDDVLEFFRDTLGFRTSDYVPGFAAFMRAFPNPLHHSLAILSAQEDKLHHVNFMVTDVDDVGRAYNRMKDAQVEIVFGPGRHQPSESIFLYFLDPDGMTVEYSFGMETFPEEGAREPRMLEPRPETLDSWGGRPTPAFAQIGAIEVVS